MIKLVTSASPPFNVTCESCRAENSLHLLSAVLTPDTIVPLTTSGLRLGSRDVLRSHRELLSCLKCRASSYLPDRQPPVLAPKLGVTQVNVDGRV